MAIVKSAAVAKRATDFMMEPADNRESGGGESDRGLAIILTRCTYV